MQYTGLLTETIHYVTELFLNKLPEELTYHNYQHTSDTAGVCAKLSDGYSELTDEDREELLIAAWFHDTGYLITFDQHEEKSKEVASRFLKKLNCAEYKISKILRYIDATRKNYKPEDICSQIIADANIADIGRDTYNARAILLKTELLRSGTIFSSETEWINLQINFIQANNFYTSEARRLFNKQRQENLDELVRRKEKIEGKEKKKEKKKLKSNDPSRGIQTMFRNIYRTHIHLSSIADSKANMMIRVNSLIISVTLTLLGAKFSFLGTSFKENQIIVIPVISLLFTGLITIIFAILSAKPTVTQLVHKTEDGKNENASMLFFGNFSATALDSYKTEMKKLIKNKDDIYESMMTDMYFLGKVLHRKYKMVTISYLCFLTGILLTSALTAWIIYYLKNQSNAN